MPLDITPDPLLPSSSPLAPPVLRRDLFLKVASARLLFDVCVTCGGWLMKLLGRTCARALATAPAAYGARLTARQTLRACIFRAAPALLPAALCLPPCVLPARWIHFSRRLTLSVHHGPSQAST